MEWNQLVWYVPPAIGGLLIGHVVGMRHARKVTKRTMQKFNEQSLDLLEARGALIQAQSLPDEQQRKDKLLKLVLTKLQQANKEVRILKLQKDELGKQHLVELSRMRARAAEACETARRACEIAVNATIRMDRLSNKKSRESYEMDETVPISLAERARMHGTKDPIVPAQSPPVGQTDLQGGKEANAR